MKLVKAKLSLTALMIVLLFALSGLTAAFARGCELRAEVKPNAYYEAFDSTVTIAVTNVSESDITVTGLMIEDRTLTGIDMALAPGESRFLSEPMRVTDRMLGVGHFFVTVYYTYPDESGRPVPSTDQIMVSVRRLEDRIDARVRFALPDRPLTGETSVPVSYILENYGETDMVNAVMICYPEGYLSTPMRVPAGTCMTIRRMVDVSALDKVSAKVSAESGYSGKEYSLEASSEGTLTLPAEASPAPSITPEAVVVPDATPNTAARSLSAENTDEGLLIRVCAGQETLTDVRLFVNGAPVRTLSVLKAGLEAQIPYIPSDGKSSYTVTASAKVPDGSEITLTSESVIYSAKATNEDAQESEDFWLRLINAPPLRTIVVGLCGAALVVLAVVMLLKKRSPNRVKADGKANKKEKH